jgi:hypothetical protein
MITFLTANPSALLKAFDDAIAKDNSKGGIATWEKNSKHYTHAAAQWTKKAYFEAHIEAGKLVFNIIKNKSTNVTVPVYGYYHGHLLETFLNHFDAQFTGTSCTPVCSGADYCKAAA